MGDSHKGASRLGMHITGITVNHSLNPIRLTRLIPIFEYPVIQIFAETRLQRFSFDYFKSPISVALSFSPQENGVSHFFVIKTICKFIQMRNEEDLDVVFQ